MPSSQNVLQLDDNLVNGQTYTFQYKCANWFCLSDISAALQQDIIANAPDFIGSLQVSSPPTTSLYNVQFTYEGDGSDVVSDVAASIAAACMAGSGDNLNFIGAVGAPASAITVSATQAAQTVATDVTGAAQSAVKDVGAVASTAVSQSGGLVNTALVGVLPLLFVVVLIILFVLPSLTHSVSEVRG